jgi:glutamate-1-semialdehyde 2,1-aminomutase
MDVVDHGMDPERVQRMLDRERSRFVDQHPRSMALVERGRAVMPNGVPMSWHATEFDPPLYVDQGGGSKFADVDGHEYVDFNVADMSMFCGYAPPPVVEAVARSVAAGSQFMLPNEDAIWVAEELARRWALPKWQFTLSASQANTEVIRVARACTGRDRVLMFDGKYHGHFDDGLVDLEDGRMVPELRGLPKDVGEHARVVQWNDVDAVAEALRERDVALLLTEPAMTNNQGLLLPEPGFHDALRTLTSEAGALLAYDETHTLVTGSGGCVGAWSLEPDAVIVGKSIGAGVPLGAYGLTEQAARVLEVPGDRGVGYAVHGRTEVATGGTLFGNPMSMAAAHAALGAVLTTAAYERASLLGERLAAGIESVFDDANLPWTAHRLGPRSGYSLSPAMPRNAVEARAAFDSGVAACHRMFLANRGVWDGIVGAGPTVPVPADERDVDQYLSAFDEFISELVG